MSHRARGGQPRWWTRPFPLGVNKALPKVDLVRNARRGQGLAGLFRGCAEGVVAHAAGRKGCPRRGPGGVLECGPAAAAAATTTTIIIIIIIIMIMSVDQQQQQQQQQQQ